MAALYLDPAGTDTEVVGNKLTDGEVGPVVHWSGHDSDDETTASPSAHFVPPGTRDHPYLETPVRCTHKPQPYVPLSSHAAGRGASEYRAPAITPPTVVYRRFDDARSASEASCACCRSAPIRRACAGPAADGQRRS